MERITIVLDQTSTESLVKTILSGPETWTIQTVKGVVQFKFKNVIKTKLQQSIAEWLKLRIGG